MPCANQKTKMPTREPTVPRLTIKGIGALSVATLTLLECNFLFMFNITVQPTKSSIPKLALACAVEQSFVQYG